MPPVLELVDHRGRLRALLHRYRAQEDLLRQLLEERQERLEEADRERTRELFEPTSPMPLAVDAALHGEVEDLATELLHVRMAVLGTAEELALHDDAPETRRHGTAC
ncbi:MAG: hypothetical protein JNL12_17220 [Planctomycetes bacterium]|nr:hypothetical protein [Planctomycetota bacterium]